MTSVNELVDQVVYQGDPDTLPPRVQEIVERHRQTLLDLAAALLAAGRHEDEVVMVCRKLPRAFPLD